jgi:hypothetical protein
MRASSSVAIFILIYSFGLEPEFDFLVLTLTRALFELLRFKALYLNMKTPLCVWVLLLAATQACVYHNQDEPTPSGVDCNAVDIMYTGNIVPIINTKCAFSGCHDGASGIPNWTLLSNLQEHKAEIKRRIMLPASDPDHMPRVGSLSESEKNALYCWIENGAVGD